jgi:hypothetical protein
MNYWWICFSLRIKVETDLRMDTFLVYYTKLRVSSTLAFVLISICEYQLSVSRRLETIRLSTYSVGIIEWSGQQWIDLE